MKSILYVGATLMIGASIYGFVDYKNSSQKTEFKTMYEAVEEDIPVVTEKKKPIETKITAETSKKPVTKKSGIKKEVLPVKSKAGEFVINVEPIPMETEATIKTEELKENKSVEKIKSTKSKKINHKLFSRGSLENKYVEKTLKPDSKSKKESKKTEIEKEL